MLGLGAMKDILLTEYMSYRVKQRHYDFSILKEIIRFGTEKYFDTETARTVAVGRHREKIVLVPYEEDKAAITPVTVHATTRQQISFRVNTGRFKPL